jgi:hypothetical protein
MVDVLERGIKYKVDLVDSNHEKLLVMQYSFRPASIDTNNTGTLSISAAGEALLKLPTTSEHKKIVTLAGASVGNITTERLLVVDRASKRIKLMPVSNSVGGLKLRNEVNEAPLIPARKESTKKGFKQALAQKTKRAPPVKKTKGSVATNADETVTL